MSAFSQDITEEERLAGFDPGAQGDETFKLESLDEYPGILPDMEFNEDPLIPEPNVTEVEDLPEEVEDVLSEIEDSEEINEDVTELDDLIDQDEIDEVVEEVDDQIEALTPEELASLGGVDQQEDIEDDFSEPISSEIEETVQYDGLIELLQSELDRSKKRKEGSNDSDSDGSPFDPDTGIRIYGDDEIEPVEDPDGGFEAYESDFPEFSDFSESDVFKEETDNPEIDEFKEDPNKTPIENEEVIEKVSQKKKKAKLSTIIILSAAAVLVVFVGWFLIASKELFIIKQKPKKEEIVQEPTVKKDITLNDRRNQNEILEFSDTTEFELYVPAEISKDSNFVIKDLYADTSEITIPDPKKIETSNITSYVPKKDTKLETASNQDLVINDKPKKRTPRKTKFKDPNRKSKSKEGLFSVQIHVTASKDDAEDWLGKLNNQGLEGFITPKVVRDQMWYRVRFGEFKTYEEAYTAAINAGFDGTWIDRLK